MSLVSTIANGLMSSLGSQPGLDYNVLHDYSVYNYSVTLGIISEDEWKSGSYLNGNIDFVIFQSGGKPISESQFNAAASQEYNPSWNFYLENFEFSQLTWGRTTASAELEIKMTVFEPYSLDQFIRACRTGAIAKGGDDLKELTRFVIKLDWIGYHQDEPIPRKASPSKYIVCRMTKMLINLSPTGTHYELEFGWAGGYAMQDPQNKVTATVTATGKNVVQALSSLVANLNKFKETSAGQGKPRDEYVFELYGINDRKPIVTLSGTQENENITLPSIEMFNSELAGSQAQAEEKRARFKDMKAEDVGKMKFDASKAEKVTLTFNHDMNYVNNMIESIMLRCLWWYAMVESRMGSASSETIEMYSIEPRHELKDEKDPATGQNTKKIIFAIRVIERSSSRLTFDKGPLPGGQARSRIVRVYDYMYTGANADVLDIKLKFDTQMNNIYPQITNRGDVDKGNLPSQSSKIETDSGYYDKFVNWINGGSSPSGSSPLGVLRQFVKIAPSNNTNAFGVNTAVSTTAAHGQALWFNYNNDNAMFQANMVILGDPLFCSSSGVSGVVQSSKKTNSFGGTPVIAFDGGLDYSSLDCFIYLKVKSGDDVDPETGYMANNIGSAYEGVYKVLKVKNMFVNGLFTQQLSISRTPYDNTSVPGSVKK
jgi:hypothetical protein